MKKKFSSFYYLVMPFPLREAYVFFNLLRYPLVRLNLSLIIFAAISAFLVIKSIVSGSHLGVYMAAKFSFLLIGQTFAQREAFFVSESKYKLRSNILLICGCIVSIAIFAGFDLWSGSGAYSTRPPAFFRGFAELAIFLIVMIIFGGSLLLVFILALMSASKTVLAGVALATLVKYPVRAVFGLLMVFASYSVIPNSDFIDRSNGYFRQFNVSVIEFSSESRGFLNRYEGTMNLVEMTRRNPSMLLVGSNQADVFDVWPEYGAGYLYKVGGLVLLTLTALYVWSAIGLSFAVMPIYAVLIGSAYSLSPISFFMYGLFGVMIKKRITRYMS